MRKKMERAAAMILSLALAGAVLTACGEGRQSPSETQQENSQGALQETQRDDSQSALQESQQDDSQGTLQESQQDDSQSASQETQQGSTADGMEAGGAEKEGQSTEGYEDNFAVDSAAAKEFAEKVQAAAADQDLEALADLTAFPVYVGLPEAGVVETREDFIKLGAETIFTEELLKSVESADIENFQPSMAGFSISGGGSCNINFGVADGALAINGINY